MASAAPLPRPVVLIVEDEALLRLHAVDIVEQAGFGTSLGFSAIYLAAAVRDRWPPIEFIIVSGMPQPEIADIPARGLFFAKPYAPEMIVDALHALAAAA